MGGALGSGVSESPAPGAPLNATEPVEELWRAGRSINGIARELGIAYGTAWNYVRAMKSASRRGEDPGHAQPA
jgi:DNA-binding CsgD family transcriptional regulator